MSVFDEPVKVFQDGADFYREGYGAIYTASIKVTDFDLEAAQKARQEFIAQANFPIEWVT